MLLRSMQKKPDPKILETIRTRIRAQMSELGISQAELADAAGVRRSGLNEVLNRDRLPGCDFIVRIAERLQVSTDYLLRAEASPIADELIGDPQVRRLLSAIATLAPENRGRVLAAIENLLETGQENNSGE